MKFIESKSIQIKIMNSFYLILKSMRFMIDYEIKT